MPRAKGCLLICMAALGQGGAPVVRCRSFCTLYRQVPLRLLVVHLSLAESQPRLISAV